MKPKLSGHTSRTGWFLCANIKSGSRVLVAPPSASARHACTLGDPRGAHLCKSCYLPKTAASSGVVDELTELAMPMLQTSPGSPLRSSMASMKMGLGHEQ